MGSSQNDSQQRDFKHSARRRKNFLGHRVGSQAWGTPQRIQDQRLEAKLSREFPTRTQKPPKMTRFSVPGRFRRRGLRDSVSPVSELLFELPYSGNALRVIGEALGEPMVRQAAAQRSPDSATHALQRNAGASAFRVFRGSWCSPWLLLAAPAAPGTPWERPGHARQPPSAAQTEPAWADHAFHETQVAQRPAWVLWCLGLSWQLLAVSGCSWSAPGCSG